MQVDVPAGQIVNKEIIFTTNIQPATVEIKGYDKVANKPIKINNMESVLVNPTPTKQLTEITISDQGKTCFEVSIFVGTLVNLLSVNTRV